MENISKRKKRKEKLQAFQNFYSNLKLPKHFYVSFVRQEGAGSEPGSTIGIYKLNHIWVGFSYSTRKKEIKNQEELIRVLNSLNLPDKFEAKLNYFTYDKQDSSLLLAIYEYTEERKFHGIHYDTIRCKFQLSQTHYSDDVITALRFSGVLLTNDLSKFPHSIHLTKENVHTYVVEVRKGLDILYSKT